MVKNWILVQMELISFLSSTSSLLSPCLCASLSQTLFILGCVNALFTWKGHCQQPQLEERDRKQMKEEGLV